jgi:outer membrane protein TolC
MGIPRRLSLNALLLLVPGAAALAQAPAPLRLEEALERAERAAYPNRIAAGETQARAAQTLAPLKGILPSLRFEFGYLRTTDPLNAFGFTLRQRAVSPAAFAPTRLNDPHPIGNVPTGLVLEQPLFNADAWLGRRAARSAHAAQAAAEQWTRAGTAFQVYRDYWGAVLAVEQVRTLEAALDAARAHVRQAEALARQGMATRSDALLASVKAGEVEALLLRARSEAGLARRGLALLMGNPADTGFTLPDSLPGGDRVRVLAALAAGDSARPGGRADVVAAGRARDASAAEARRAVALYLPRLNGFGRIDWNDPDTPFGGRSSWSLGVMLTWSPFAGASELAEIRAAGGLKASAMAMADAAVAQAALELERATDAQAVALARLAIAEQNVVQAREAHRIVARKYDGGLASVTELLDAAAAETTSNLGAAAARYDALVASAERRRAQGLALTPLVEN